MNSPRKWMNTMMSSVLAIILALVAIYFIVLAMGLDANSAMSALAVGSFGSKKAIGETLLKTAPLILTGLAFALPKQCGLINLGAEGQMCIGGLCAVIVGIFAPGLPPVLHVTLAILAGCAGGMLWGSVVGFLKVRFGASELIVTIMLNYVASCFVNYMACVAIVEPPGNLPQTAKILDSARMAPLFGGMRVNAGILIALGCLLIYYVFLRKTQLGFETRVVGLNPGAADYAGINKQTKVMLAMALAGAFAGLAGAFEILGVQGRLYNNFAPGYGFDGLAVALLGQMNPVGMLLSAVLFAALRSGSNMMNILASVPVAIIYIIQAVVMVAVVCSQSMEILVRRIEIRKKAKEAR